MRTFILEDDRSFTKICILKFFGITQNVDQVTGSKEICRIYTNIKLEIPNERSKEPPLRIYK